MSLVLANTISLWKQTSTNEMQSPPSSLILFQSHSGFDSWHSFDHWPPHSLLLYHHHIFSQMPASIYLIFHSPSFQKGHSPQGRDHPLQCAILPLYWFLQMQPTENGHHLFLPRRGWSLLDIFPIISSPEKYSDLHKNLSERALQKHIHCFLPLFILLLQLLMQGNRMHWLLNTSLLCTLTFRNQKSWSLRGMRMSAALISVCCGNWCGPADQYSETPCIWRMSSRCQQSP